MIGAVAAIGARIADIEARFAPPGAASQFPAIAAELGVPPGGDARTVGDLPLAGRGQVGGVAPQAGAISSPAPAAALSSAPVQPASVRTGEAVPAERWAHRLPAAAGPWIGSIERAAVSAGIDPRLLASLVQAESGFRPDAVSHAGAIGLGQLMPGTARELGVDPTDPQQNLDGAARYLRSQLDRFGSVELALAAYNAGPGRVAQAGGVPRITETQNYVQRVTATYDQLRSNQ